MLKMKLLTQFFKSNEHRENSAVKVISFTPLNIGSSSTTMNPDMLMPFKPGGGMSRYTLTGA